MRTEPAMVFSSRKKRGYGFLAFLLSLLINVLIFAIAPMLLEQTGMTDLLPHALLNLKMPPRSEQPGSELEQEVEMRDENPQPEPMEPELEIEPPDVPEMLPPELEIPPLASPQDSFDEPAPEISRLEIPLKTVSMKSVPVALPSAAPASSPPPASAPQPAARPNPQTAKEHKKNGGYSLAQVDAAPRAMNQTLPRYPRRARQRNIEGWVKVRFLVDKEGRVRNLRILKESPSGVFYKTVMETAPRWRFSPATKEGRPVNVWVEQTINFRMDDAW